MAFLFCACSASLEPNQDGGDPDPTGDSATDTDIDTGIGIGTDADTNSDIQVDTDTNSDRDTDTGSIGVISGAILVNHLGWKPQATKAAVLLEMENVTVELRRGSDDSVADSFVSSGLLDDEDSGDQFSTLDFSSFQSSGSYYLYIPATGERSYAFSIREDVYNIVGAVAMKSFYFQRCNHDKTNPYAGDALGGFAGSGGQWVDGSCHLDDSNVSTGPGSPDHGNLDLHGGWHDAGDYQKTLWGRGMQQMLWAAELGTDVWSDGQLNIPESGNGIPDILDELKWELDFYVRMQRPDGHYMTSVKGRDATVTSPPSASDEGRVYFDTTSPSGGGWSGGGVTIYTATANATLNLAHAAIVFDSIAQSAIANSYRSAALAGWAFLNGEVATSANERHIQCAAASAIYRLDSTLTSARNVVESFSWADWDGLLPYSVTPADAHITSAAWHYLSNADGNNGIKETIREAVGAAIVDRAFEEQGVYGGMFGGPGNAWDWSWGSNRNIGMYGSNLMLAAHFGISEASISEIETLAKRYFHYMLGLNPLNMVYLTNMAAYGGEHSSFQIYHSWFSHTGGDGDNGNMFYNGKPDGVTEPLYPYYADDDQTSTYGPSPGLVPGGPNMSYSGSYIIPNRSYPAYAYRDWSVGCDWNGSICASASWEITEPMCAYQGPFVLLASFMMSAF